jgi:hypothetical protein
MNATADRIVGRDDVQARLRAVVDTALAGGSAAILLAGEAGIGKSALLAAAGTDADARGAQVARAWGWPGEGAPAFWLWRQVLRELSIEIADESTVDDPAAARFALFDCITSALLAESRMQPVVLVLDDLHWADGASLRLLEFAVRRSPAGALGVLGAFRDTEPSPGLAELAATVPVQRLAGLSPSAVGELAARGTGRDLSAEAAAELHRRTGGNPFLVQQVAWLPAGTTPAVDAVLAERFAGLPPATLATVSATAAIAGPVRPELLTAAFGTDAAALEPALAARILIREADGLRFAHDLLREYAYERVPAAERATRHAQIAQALQIGFERGEEVEPAEIADHYVRADPAGALAHRWSVVAAEDAGRRLAYEQAAWHWEQAVPGAGADRLATLLSLGEAGRRAGLTAVATRAYRRAADLARRDGDADGLGRAALGLHAVGRRTFADHADLVALHDEALSMMDDSDLKLRVMASLARVLAWNGFDPARARGLAEAAVEQARSSADPSTVAAGLLARHLAFAGPGLAGERLDVVAELLDLAGRTGDRGLAAEAHLLATSDRLELADPGFRTELDAFLRLADSAGDPRLRYAALVRRTMLALLAGRVDEAARLSAAATQLGHEVGEAGTADVHFEHSWDLAVAQGRLGSAMGLVQQAFPDAESVVARGLRTLVLLAAGDRAGAEELAAPMLESPPATTVPSGQWLLDLAYAVDLVAGLEARLPAQWLYDTLLPYADLVVVSGVAVAMRGAVAHLLGRLAVVLDRPDQARAHHEAALRIHDDLGAVAWSLRSRFELARLAAPAPSKMTEFAVEAGRLGLAGLAAEARELAARSAAESDAIFRREGPQWTLTYAGATVRLPDAKGLADLAVLLAAPGQPVAAADLVAAGGAGAAGQADLRMGSDEMLDAAARRAYRGRLAELTEEIEQAQAWSDPVRAERARDERDALLAELAAAAGLAGRGRRLGDQSERARKTVTARIRDSLRRVESVHPVLGSHLSASVSTGTWCVYSPASPVSWQT